MVQKIVNLTLQSGIMPKALKKAVVKQLIKKPNLDHDVRANYRPVSNLFVFMSKILDRTVSQQLRTHLDANNLLVKFQSAYRCGHSTETALLRVLNNLLSIDAGNNALLIVLNLQDALTQ